MERDAGARRPRSPTGAGPASFQRPSSGPAGPANVRARSAGSSSLPPARWRNPLSSYPSAPARGRGPAGDQHEEDRPRRRNRHDRRAADRSVHRLRQAPRHRRGDVPQAHADDDRAREGQPPAPARRRSSRSTRTRRPTSRRSATTSPTRRRRRSSGPRSSSTARRPATRTRRSTRSSPGPRGFLAQGSEFGFGKPYAMGINDEALSAGQGPLPPDRLLQHAQHRRARQDARRGWRRRPSPSSGAASSACAGPTTSPRTPGFAPAPSAGKHDDPVYGTHHARDASRLLETIGWKPQLFSSAMKLNTQYMHSPLVRPASSPGRRRGRRPSRSSGPTGASPLTEKRSANQIFSFGRDHGYYGRILSQAVVAAPDGDRQRRPRARGLLLHAAGRQLARLFDRRRALADGAGLRPASGSSVLDRFFFREI